MDGHGNAIFGWTFFQQSSGDERVQIRRRSAAGALAAVQTLSTTGHDAKSAHIAVNSAGASVAVWRLDNGDANLTTPVQGRARTAGGTLSPLFTVSARPGGNFSFEESNPDVVIDGAGNATFTWIGLDSNQKKRAYARRRAANGAFGPVLVLSPPTVSSVKMAVNAAGTTVFVWVFNDGEGSNLIEARRLSPSGTLGPTRIIAKGIEFSGGGGAGTGNPAVGVDGQGNALIVWEQPDGEGPCGINGCPKILSRTFLKNDAVGSVPQTFSTTVSGGKFPQVAMASNGNAVVAWVHNGVEFRTRSAAGVRGALRNFTTASGISEPVLKGDPTGNTVAVWNNAGFVEARRLTAGGTLGAIVKYRIGAQPAFSARVAVGSGGDAAVAWGQSDGLGQCSGGSACNRIGGAIHP
jgi:hypothetical protein